MPAPVYFLSYSRKNIEDIGAIAKTVMIHGIEVWQDISNLGTGVSEQRIRHAIRKHCDGLLFLATRHSVNSEFIRAVELPEAERKFKGGNNFQIVPIFELPIETVTTELRGCLTIPISNFNGVKVIKQGSCCDMMATARRAAELILENTKIARSDPLHIGLSSKQSISEDVALHLNFSAFFELGLPSMEIWTRHFQPAIYRVKDALVARNLLSLRLHSFAHLSLAYLFGHVFRGTAGYRLEITQITNNAASIWATDAPIERNPLTPYEFPCDLGSRNLFVKINLMSRYDNSVRRYSQKNGIRYRALLEFCPKRYPCVISAGEAVAIAADLVQWIKELHARYDTNAVYLFTAIPVGLAVLIGHNLNACGTVYCHEFDNGMREYFPSCTLV